MNVKELITEITNAAGVNGLEREVEFRAIFEMGVSTSADDQNKEMTLSFDDCMASTSHPTKLQILLC